MDFSEGAARATVAVCDWTGVFCLGFVITSTWYPYAVVPVISARERSTLQCVWHSLVRVFCLIGTRRVGSRGKNSLAHQPTQSAMSTGVPATTAPVTTMAAPTTTYGGCCQLPNHLRGQKNAIEIRKWYV